MNPIANSLGTDEEEAALAEIAFGQIPSSPDAISFSELSMKMGGRSPALMEYTLWILRGRIKEGPVIQRRETASTIRTTEGGVAMCEMGHETKAILVWADIDLGVVDMVQRLNQIPGCRTIASCQGTIGEGGPHPYPAHVMATWSLEALLVIKKEFDVFPEENGAWGNVVRKGDAWPDTGAESNE